MDPQQTAGFAGFLAQTDAVGKAILVILLLMSIATWYLIVTKSITIVLERRKSARFLDGVLGRALARGGGKAHRGPTTRTIRSRTSPGTRSVASRTTSAPARPSSPRRARAPSS